MGDGERRHRQRDTAPFANQDDQGQNEQQVIEAEQDVLDAQTQIGCGDLTGTGRRRTTNDVLVGASRSV